MNVGTFGGGGNIFELIFLANLTPKGGETLARGGKCPPLPSPLIETLGGWKCTLNRDTVSRECQYQCKHN